jgi:hypothetical protein
MLPSGTQVYRVQTEAVGFFGRQNPQHAFLRRGSKAVCPMSQFRGMLKNPAITWKLDCLDKFDRLFLAHNFLLSLTDFSHAVWPGAPLEMNGELRLGEKVQTALKAEVR